MCFFSSLRERARAARGGSRRAQAAARAPASHAPAQLGERLLPLRPAREDGHQRVQLQRVRLRRLAQRQRRRKQVALIARELASVVVHGGA
jgi:hypothetical protein